MRHTVAALDIEAPMFIDHNIHPTIFQNNIRNGAPIEQSLSSLKSGTHQDKAYLDASRSVYA